MRVDGENGRTVIRFWRHVDRHRQVRRKLQKVQLLLPGGCEDGAFAQARMSVLARVFLARRLRFAGFRRSAAFGAAGTFCLFARRLGARRSAHRTIVWAEQHSHDSQSNDNVTHDCTRT